MSQGTTISGVDGIIRLGATEEIPCLKSWNFNSTSAIETQDTKCMKSNNDGGSTANGGFAKKTPGNKSATFDATFQWQEDEDAGAMGQLRTTAVGTIVTFSLFPHLATAGKRVISGTAIIASISIPSEVSGVITQTVNFEVDGEWDDDVVSA